MCKRVAGADQIPALNPTLSVAEYQYNFDPDTQHNFQ